MHICIRHQPTQDEEQAFFWKTALEKGPSSRVDTAKTVSLLKKSLESMNNHIRDEIQMRSAEHGPALARANSELTTSAPVASSMAHRSPVLHRATSDLLPLGSASSAVRYCIALHPRSVLPTQFPAANPFLLPLLQGRCAC